MRDKTIYKRESHSRSSMVVGAARVGRGARGAGAATGEVSGRGASLAGDASFPVVRGEVVMFCKHDIEHKIAPRSKAVLCATLFVAVTVALALTTVSCSTTKRLGDGEVLYTGVRRIDIEPLNKDGELPAGVKSTVKSALSVKPNNPLISPYVRTPLPTGLWAWNNLYTERRTGFGSWIFRRLAKQPVLISRVKPEARAALVLDILDNHGCFGSQAKYEIIEQRNHKKARVSYSVSVAEPWSYSRVEYPECVCELSEAIDGFRDESSIVAGARYNIDSLTNERIRLTNLLRDESYYYFRPEYLEYLADTTQQRYMVDIRMNLALAMPEAARRPYSIGQVSLFLMSNTGKGEVRDTVIGALRVQYQGELRVRPKILAALVTTTPGSPAKRSLIGQTVKNFNRIGVFRSVNLAVTPLDSLGGRDTLDIAINTVMDRPLEAEFEADLSSKSSSFIGPGAIISIRNNNAFRGGESFALLLKGHYEWQTGNNRTADHAISINSFEVGMNASLMKPLISESVIKRDKHLDSRLTFNLGADILNRPSFFTMLSTELSGVYDFRTSEQNTHSLSLFKLVYNKLMHTTSAFDAIIDDNEALALSFQNQLIPSIGYTYTLDRRYGSNADSRVIWQSTVTEAGNILAAAYGLFGKSGQKRLFGELFSQYVRLTSEIKHTYRINSGSVLASRFMAGVGHAYGNSNVMPYTEQFSSGGANSIRAFTVRTLGPGSYVPDPNKVNGYFDQTGTFRLEANIEYRFRMSGGLHGAVFLDMGNIWLLKEDRSRPGANLGAGDFWNSVATGTGVGLRYDLSFLVVRADLGIGIHTPYQNPQKGGYYNIGKFKDGLALHLAIGYPF